MALSGGMGESVAQAEVKILYVSIKWTEKSISFFFLSSRKSIIYFSTLSRFEIFPRYIDRSRRRQATFSSRFSKSHTHVAVLALHCFLLFLSRYLRKTQRKDFSLRRKRQKLQVLEGMCVPEEGKNNFRTELETT